MDGQNFSKPKPAKKKKRLLIILGVIMVILIILAIIFVPRLISTNSSDSGNPDESSEPYSDTKAAIAGAYDICADTGYNSGTDAINITIHESCAAAAEDDSLAVFIDQTNAKMSAFSGLNLANFYAWRADYLYHLLADNEVMEGDEIKHPGFTNEENEQIKAVALSDAINADNMLGTDISARNVSIYAAWLGDSETSEKYYNLALARNPALYDNAGAGVEEDFSEGDDNE